MESGPDVAGTTADAVGDGGATCDSCNAGFSDIHSFIFPLVSVVEPMFTIPAFTAKEIYFRDLLLPVILARWYVDRSRFIKPSDTAKRVRRAPCSCSSLTSTSN